MSGLADAMSELILGMNAVISGIQAEDETMDVRVSAMPPSGKTMKIIFFAMNAAGEATNVLLLEMCHEGKAVNAVKLEKFAQHSGRYFSNEAMNTDSWEILVPANGKVASYG